MQLHLFKYYLDCVKLHLRFVCTQLCVIYFVTRVVCLFVSVFPFLSPPFKWLSVFQSTFFFIASISMKVSTKVQGLNVISLFYAFDFDAEHCYQIFMFVRFVVAAVAVLHTDEKFIH